MTLRIAVDAACWANGRGYGRFARELTRAMVTLAPEDEFLWVGDRATFEAFTVTAPNARTVSVPLGASPTSAASAEGYRSPGDLLRLTRAVHRLRPDVFFSPSVYTYFPLPPGQRGVVTIHDTIAERFPALTLPTRRARWFWGMKVGLALRQCRLVLTVSEFAAREIARVLRVPPGRIRVAVEAPAPAYRPAEPGTVAAAAAAVGLPPGASWFTYVGGFSPHKRLDLVVRAHATLARERDDPPRLLLIGRRSGDVFLGVSGTLDALIADLGTGPLVHWTGFLPDEAVAALHSGAVACLLPSECEGFGLPAVEAAACGAPVVATTASPLPELLGDGGRFVAPGDLEGLTAAMRELAGAAPLRAALGAAGMEAAGRLSWRRAAASALDALREAAA